MTPLARARLNILDIEEITCADIRALLDAITMKMAEAKFSDLDINNIKRAADFTCGE